MQTTGTVKWFNATKGYGFIQPDDGGPDAFVHISAVERAGMDTLREGQRVSYELVRGKNGKSSAENLQLQAEAAAGASWATGDIARFASPDLLRRWSG